MAAIKNINRENFCQFFVETGNATEAYRRAYSCKNKNENWVRAAASRMLTNVNILQRVGELRQEAAERNKRSVDEVVSFLVGIIDGDEVTDFKRSTVTSGEHESSSITTTTVSKQWALERLCKIMGYDSPTKNELTGANGSALFPSFTVEVIDRREQVEGRADTTDTAGTA